MATQAQTLSAILDFLGLEKGASAEDITREIAKRSVARGSRVAKWTPLMSDTGEMRFSGTKVRLAADEIDPLREALASDAFREFLAENADALQTRKVVNAARREKRDARRAELEADAA